MKRGKNSLFGRSARAAIVAGAVALIASGVALASFVGSPASGPPAPPVRVSIPTPSAPTPAPPAAARAATRPRRPLRPATNRAVVYSPPPAPPTPTVQAVAAQQPSAIAPPPPPILGQRGTTTVVAGAVRIRLKGTNRFVSLSGSAGIPNGSEVDATDGRVLLTVAAGHAGRTATAEVYGGIFEFHQARSAHALTRLALTLPLDGCPRRGPTRRHRHGSHARGAAQRSGSTSRHLWVSESGGHWGTGGRYVSTTVEGTHWLTLDECNRSEVEVAAGKVSVRNLINDTTTVIGAGQSYVASADPGTGVPSSGTHPG